MPFFRKAKNGLHFFPAKKQYLRKKYLENTSISEIFKKNTWFQKIMTEEQINGLHYFLA
jgi:hypothetical protein